MDSEYWSFVFLSVGRGIVVAKSLPIGKRSTVEELNR